MKELLTRLLKRRNFIIILIITSIVFMMSLFKLGLIPLKYLLLIIVVLLFINVGMIFLLQPWKKRHRHKKHKKKYVRYKVGKCLSALLSGLLIIGSIYLAQGNNAFTKMFGQHEEKMVYSVIVNKESIYEKLKDIDNKNLGLGPADSEYQSKVIAVIEGKIKVNTKDYLTYEKLYDSLKTGEVNAIVLNEAYRDTALSIDKNFSKNTRVIWQYTLHTSDTQVKEGQANSNGSFNIFISGSDSRSKNLQNITRSDVDMIVSVNPNTRQIRMTSIPRDYYVTLASINKKDKLTHAGLLGINNLVNTVENFMNIDINYYAKVNFNSLITVVDALGGIDIYNDQTLNLLHGKRLKEGMVHMDGSTALAFARERYAYKQGDRHRAQNQQDVLTAIFKKMLSTKILTNYTQILAAISDMFSTNMPMDKMKELVTLQLENGGNWRFSKGILEGKGKTMKGGYFMPSSNLYYMIPDETSISDNSQAIKEVIEGR